MMTQSLDGAGYIPVPVDYDGDGLADLSALQRSNPPAPCFGETNGNMNVKTLIAGTYSNLNDVCIKKNHLIMNEAFWQLCRNLPALL